MIAAIIPARGGSKGIPRKNLVPIGGVPIIVRSVRHALGSAFVSETWVSTDDEDIADAASVAGAKVFRRSTRYAQDESSSDDAVLEWLHRHL